MYDSNTLTYAGVRYSSFSRYRAGRLVAVRNRQFST